MDDVRKEVEKWPPDEVERVTGLPEAQIAMATWPHVRPR
jgi:formate dehydrogenase major subunit